MSLTETIQARKTNLLNSIARSHIGYYAKRVNPSLEFEDFHKVYYEILDRFAKGQIKKLIITEPPQHGKSEGSSRILPSYLLGIDPNKKIAIGSYAATIAQKFNRDVQRYIGSSVYQEIFPETKLNSSNVVTVVENYLKNATEFEVVNKKGSLVAVGRGGSLTSRTVDVAVLDDVYKDSQEGNSPIVRESAWSWFIDVVKSRLHNDSQELIVFTRWHEDDIIGRLEELGEVIEVSSWEELENAPKDKYIKINFEAIKESPRTEFDPRDIGESLWENKHNLKGLNEKRRLDPLRFDCLYQGKPESKEGLLYGEFRQYDTMPRMIMSKGNCTDTADEGEDFLASINYNKVRYKFPDDERERTYLFVTDLLFTQESMEITEKALALMLDRDGTRIAHIESNNGGRGFARKVREFVKGACKVVWYHQSKNKESRILTNATTVMDRIVFPIGWEKKYPEAHRVLRTYKKLFKANKHDDLADVLTSIVEKEIVQHKGSGVKRQN